MQLEYEMNELSAETPHIATQQEKLDAIFGITGGKSVDEFLDDLSFEDANQRKNEALDAIGQLSAISQSMNNKMDEIQAMPTSFAGTSPNELSIQMMSMDHSLKELEEMVDLSKDVIKHVHSSILATPLIDSEAVQAYSKLVESIHISISEFIGVYRDKQNFINKVKYALFDYQQKKDLLRYKADLQIEIMKAKEGPKSIDAEATETGQQNWSVEAITKILDKQNGTAQTIE